MAGRNEALKPVDDRVAKLLLKSRARFESFLTQRLKDRETAQDLLQESLVRAITRSKDLRASDRLIPWFFQILRNALIDYYRSHGAEGRRNEAFLQSLEDVESRKKAKKRMEDAMCSCMEGLLPALKPEYAQLIKRIDLENGSIAETAKALKTTPNNVMVRLHRARKALKTSLEKTCGACTEHGCLNCSCH